MNKCNCCYYHDAKENACTHGSPIFIDDVCTDYQDDEFVMQIKADVIDEYTDLLIRKCYAKFSSLEYVTEEEIREIVKKLKEQK